MDDLSGLGNFLLGVAVAGAVLAIVYGLPRLLRSANRWTSSALFGALNGWARAISPLVSSLALLWLLMLAGALYSPLIELGVEALPSGGERNVAVLAFALPFGTLAVVLPLAFGAGEAAARGERGRKLLLAAVSGFTRLGAVALALVALLPWVVWQRAAITAARMKRETFPVEIETGSYISVAEALRGRFDDAGLRASVGSAPPAVRAARRLVDSWGPPAFRSRQPYQIKVIEADGVTLTLYENMLDLVSERKMVARARSAVLGRLPPEGLWWTRSAEARELEETILQRNGAQLGGDIAGRLASLNTGTDEWYALQREYLLVAAARNPGS